MLYEVITEAEQDSPPLHPLVVAYAGIGEVLVRHDDLLSSKAAEAGGLSYNFV